MDATQDPVRGGQGPLATSTACCCDLTSCCLLQQAFTRTMVLVVLRVALQAAMKQSCLLRSLPAVCLQLHGRICLVLLLAIPPQLLWLLYPGRLS